MLKILIVEDDVVISKYLQLILSKYGNCDIAEDGEEAIEYFRQSLVTKSKYDVIFMDIMMPRMDGHRALQEMREMEENIDVVGLQKSKIIMTSALKDSETIKKAFQNFADGYITKPILKGKIISELERNNLIS